jgi:hypothetical protein
MRLIKVFNNNQIINKKTSLKQTQYIGFNMDQEKICFGLKNNSINNFIENKKFAQNHFYCCANILFLSHFLCFCYKGECKLIV